MNEYERRVRKERARVDGYSRATIERFQEILESAIAELNSTIPDTDTTLGARWKRNYLKALKAKLKEVQEVLHDVYVDGMKKGAKVGTSLYEDWLNKHFKDLSFDNSFSSMFSRVQDNVIMSLLEGGMYRDGKTLSERIWNLSKCVADDIEEVIARDLLLKKSARNMAKDLEQFIRPPEEKRKHFKDSHEYTYHRNKKVRRNAERLARTVINHAYQTSTIQGARATPFCDGLEWIAANDHRVCPLCMTREGKVFKPDDVPLDHPNGRCCLAPYFSKPSDEINEEIRKWIHGEENERLDEWYAGMVAQDLIEEKSKIEPKITEIMKDVADVSGGFLTELEYRLKKSDSLKDKILRNVKKKKNSIEETSANIYDILRYTMIYDEEEFTENYFKAEEYFKEKGYSIVRIKNAFTDESVYKGLNILVRDEKAGDIFELQFHTQISFDIKQRMHPIYEQMRMSDNAVEKASLLAEMAKLSKKVRLPKDIIFIVNKELEL